MPHVRPSDLERMRSELLFDGEARGRKLSRFWILLVLAAVIASAGIVSDSTATVIGAMIVAPLMTPILGTAFSAVSDDRANLLRSVALVVGGAAAVVLVGWIVGSLTSVPAVAATSSQVAGRINPRLIDLLAALATGAVGAFALVRDDVSDTLPGVAIAISLVPPLAVVGLTLEAGATDESLGALLLFVTNVTAIILTGLVVMTAYGVHRVSVADGGAAVHPAGRFLLVAGVTVIVGIPLAINSVVIGTTTLTHYAVSDVATSWSEGSGWEVVSVEPVPGSLVVVRAVGPEPSPDPRELRRMLDDAGLAGVDVRLELVPETEIVLPAGG
jgi:uncharacterized hydrophobic protein (TIGR00271 family)